MELLESEIEEIIYNSPWLLDENYIIPQIQGSRGEYGRQVKRVNKFIDLLFKDTRDNRPVLVELKKGPLTRDSIGQILEYKTLLLSIDEEEREVWLKEFGRNYYCPKLILIGSDVDETIMIAASLAGIEIRIFTLDFTRIGLSSFESIVERQKEWNHFRNSGVRAVHEREEWINDLIDQINEFLIVFPKKVYTIKKVPQLASSKIYTQQGNPFINIPFYNENDECISGIYEFHDESLPFNDKFVYFEFNFVNEIIDSDLLILLKQQVQEFCLKNKLDFTAIGPNLLPIIKVNRTVLENPKSFTNLLEKFLTESIEMNNQCLKINSLNS